MVQDSGRLCVSMDGRLGALLESLAGLEIASSFGVLWSACKTQVLREVLWTGRRGVQVLHCRWHKVHRNWSLLALS